MWALALFVVILCSSAGAYIFIKKRRENTFEHNPLFKGIRYLITNEHDRAIEEFVKSVKLDSDTIETYIALADLYRLRGEIDRAIRIRQNIIRRPNLDKKTKLMALFDIGLDYKKGGFLDRALYIFQQVIHEDPKNLKALKEIEKIYVDTKEWEKAYDVRKKIESLEKGNHKHILAHYLVEMAKIEEKRGDLKKAISFFNKAINTHRQCADAYLHLGDVYFKMGRHKDAISAWKKVLTEAPEFVFLAYKRLEDSFFKIKETKAVEKFLDECIDKRPDVFIYMAYAVYLHSKNEIDAAISQLNKAIEIDPFFWEARRLKGKILLEHGRYEEALKEFKDIIDKISTPSLRFQCEICGYESLQLQWQCPGCKKWDTMHIIRPSIKKE